MRKDTAPLHCTALLRTHLLGLPRGGAEPGGEKKKLTTDSQHFDTLCTAVQHAPRAASTHHPGAHLLGPPLGVAVPGADGTSWVGIRLPPGMQPLSETHLEQWPVAGWFSS